MSFGGSYQAAGAGEIGDAAKLQKYSHNIGSSIQKINQNVKSMQQLVNQLGTDQDNPQLQAQLHKVQQYTNGLAKDTTAELRIFKNITPPAGEEGRGWRVQQERLREHFTKALNEFQEIQRKAASKEKEALKKVRAETDTHFFDKDQGKGGSVLLDIEGRGGGGGGAPSSASQGLRSPHEQMQMQLEQEQELSAIRERESQIRQLETDITDVNQIFKDLATMVHEQGEVIDSIEANVETAQVNVQQGNVELFAARNYKNKARRKKLILSIILAIVIAIILGLIIWSAKS